MNKPRTQNVTSLANPFASRETAITVHSDGRPPLRIDWIEQIFTVLSAAFGRQFADQWAGIDPAEMKALWATKLSAFFDQPDAIRRALDDATDQKFPPNVGEFKALALRHYREKPATNPNAKVFERKANPEMVAEMMRVLNSKSMDAA